MIVDTAHLGHDVKLQKTANKVCLFLLILIYSIEKKPLSWNLSDEYIFVQILINIRKTDMSLMLQLAVNVTTYSEFNYFEIF